MKLYFLIAITIITSLFISGCAALQSNTSTVSVNNVNLEALRSSEYDVIGETNGNATQTTILGCISYGDMGTLIIPLPIIGSFFIIPGGKVIEDIAKYNAVRNKEGGDALISPRSERTSVFIPGLYTKETVTIRAKAIKIKERK